MSTVILSIFIFMAVLCMGGFLTLLAMLIDPVRDTKERLRSSEMKVEAIFCLLWVLWLPFALLTEQIWLANPSTSGSGYQKRVDYG